ncbi:dihydrodipicolinate synthase family protein [Blastopirellula marina]|uniref:Dihydrodipicolinate synthase DapA n=1 Tax=Blastopirellula marina DSM 3645 TaxID=314230 RepID=A3ZUS3_9BACT|nr:dihydrodipicolinate synthase family protein [Blastopirellula marina]EAQ79659.1 dihydrodipicolinate synthase DapA [Blastopirellula marina DSM 3645]
MSTFHGIVPPLVTPLLGRDQLDHEGLERLIEHVLEGGVHGLFILGSTGEAPSLSYRLRREVIAAVCRQTDNRVPVLVGVTDTAFVESIALAQYAADAGAAAVVLSTPYYFPAGQTELRTYVRNIVSELPLPLMLYNMPALTKVWFEIETLQKLTDLDGIVGLKDSSGDLDYFAKATRLKEQRPDWSILIGPEAMLPAAMRLGGDGGVNGGANILPRLFVECYDSIITQDEVKLAELHRRIVDFQRIYDVGKYASKYIKATKCCLSLLNICDDFMAEPFHSFHPPEREQLAQILQELDIPVVQG